MNVRRLAAPLLAGLPPLAGAHEGGADALPTAHAGWNPDPLVLVPLAAAALLFAAGRSALSLRGRGGTVRAREALAFAAGLLAILVALVSPVDRLSEAWFSVHMAQHELLMLVAAPLLVFARPLVPLLAALPPRWQARLVALSRRPGFARAWAFLTAPLVALLLHALARWAWHLPAAFDAALEHRAVHALQHLSFFATAGLFWWSIVSGRYGRAGYGLGVLAVFATAAHTGLLGAILTLAPRPLYRTYVARLGAGAGPDQQLAGLVMWVPAGALLTALGLALFAAWLGESARRARKEPA